MSGTRRSFVTGIAAGGAALATSYFLRIFAGGLFVPELAAQMLFSITPGSVESQAISTLGEMAKNLAFASAIIGSLILYGGIGILLHKTYRRLAPRGLIVNVSQFILVPYLVLLVVAVILFMLTEISTQPLTVQIIILYLVPPHIVYGLILYHIFKMQQKQPATAVTTPEHIRERTLPQDEGVNINKVGRRQFIRILSIVVAGSIASVFVFYWADLFSRSRPLSSSSPPPPLQSPILSNTTRSSDLPSELLPFFASEITPNDRFYRVDINIATPTIIADMWKLRVTGLIDNPLELSYGELRSLPSIEEYATLECVSNKVGGDLISTALWKGVSLKSVLEMAQVRPEARYVVFKCFDGYDVGIPLEKGLEETTLLAYEMNRATLPTNHGFPVRAIVPGIYGMMNAKWVTEIELVDTVYEGFWQRKGWSNEAKYKIHSTVVVPGSALSYRFGSLGEPTTVTLGTKVPIAGIAFAGNEGISKVEVSMDGGKSWQEAKMKRPISINSWALWYIEWNPNSQGRHIISVRATDGTGKIQPVGFHKPFPDGSSGYHMIEVMVQARA
ncbi:MAG: molybdopterin-dependent oxidoreductase [Thermoproteota archaeon]|nr:molybdopterin-dependent oxidoreductase [Thermoproteota archaeon]